ncbi:unnamed protein product, partial [Mycena citricolor]
RIRTTRSHSLLSLGARMRSMICVTISSVPENDWPLAPLQETLKALSAAKRASVVLKEANTNSAVVPANTESVPPSSFVPYRSKRLKQATFQPESDEESDGCAEPKSKSDRP